MKLASMPCRLVSTMLVAFAVLLPRPVAAETTQHIPNSKPEYRTPQVNINIKPHALLHLYGAPLRELPVRLGTAFVVAHSEQDFFALTTFRLIRVEEIRTIHLVMPSLHPMPEDLHWVKAISIDPAKMRLRLCRQRIPTPAPQAGDLVRHVLPFSLLLIGSPSLTASALRVAFSEYRPPTTTLNLVVNYERI